MKLSASVPPGLLESCTPSVDSTQAILARLSMCLARLEGCEAVTTRTTQQPSSSSSRSAARQSALGVSVTELLAKLRDAEARSVEDLEEATMAQLGASVDERVAALRRLRGAYNDFNGVAQHRAELRLSLLNAALHRACDWPIFPFVPVWRFIASRLEEGIDSIGFCAFVDVYVALRAGRAAAVQLNDRDDSRGPRHAVVMRELVETRGELRAARADLALSQRQAAALATRLRHVTIQRAEAAMMDTATRNAWRARPDRPSGYGEEESTMMAAEKEEEALAAMAAEKRRWRAAGAHT